MAKSINIPLGEFNKMLMVVRAESKAATKAVASVEKDREGGEYNNRLEAGEAYGRDEVWDQWLEWMDEAKCRYKT